MNYRVYSSQPGDWSVAAPTGRIWTGLPSQPAALQLARSLAGVTIMLAQIRVSRRAA